MPELQYLPPLSAISLKDEKKNTQYDVMKQLQEHIVVNQEVGFIREYKHSNEIWLLNSNYLCFIIVTYIAEFTMSYM